MDAIDFGLEHCVPGKCNAEKLTVDIELFYQPLQLQNPDMRGDDNSMAKTKLLDTYSKCRNIKTTYNYHKAVKTSSGDTQIIVLKQDKGRGVVVLDRSLCKDSCLEILSDESTFRESMTDPTKYLESKVQESIRNIKQCLSDNEY